MTPKEKRYLILTNVFCVLGIGLSILHIYSKFYIPGLQPIVTAAFWFFLWQFQKIRGTWAGGIWTFMALLIIGLNITSGISQILNAIT